MCPPVWLPASSAVLVCGVRVRADDAPASAFKTPIAADNLDSTAFVQATGVSETALAVKEGPRHVLWTRYMPWSGTVCVSAIRKRWGRAIYASVSRRRSRLGPRLDERRRCVERVKAGASPSIPAGSRTTPIGFRPSG